MFCDLESSQPETMQDLNKGQVQNRANINSEQPDQFILRQYVPAFSPPESCGGAVFPATENCTFLIVSSVDMHRVIFCLL